MTTPARQRLSLWDVSAQDLAARYEHRSDRDSSLSQALLGLGDRGRKQWIGSHRAAAIMASYSNTFGPRGASSAIRVIARATTAA